MRIVTYSIAQLGFVTFCPLEGLDRSGKTSIARALGVLTQQALPVLDRFTISHRVYDQFFERASAERVARYSSLESCVASLGVWMVFVDTPVNLCLKRGAQYTEQELRLQRQMFIKELCELRAREPLIKVFSISGAGEVQASVKRLIRKFKCDEQWKGTCT